MNEKQGLDQLDGIAIIGMSGRFPGAPSLDGFWKNLCDGIESIVPISDEQLLAAGQDPDLIASPSYVKAVGALDGIEWFDADFFGFTPREAELTDPQHRIFLECAWEALEDAGYDPGQYAGRIGVFAGSGMYSCYTSNVLSNPGATRLLGELARYIALEKDFLTTRVSYRLNLKGPSLCIQTACSTSLVAVHIGCQSLLNGESDMVLAGGVSLRIPQVGYLYEVGSITSPDGHCRAFDADAAGTVFSSGAGIVVLKRLADAVADGDCIRAVIRGSAINNDGAMKVGYTAPSIEGQAGVIADAQAVADVKADEISYVETHGTGTKLGEPIEIAALTKAFRATTQDNNFCAIGSLKTNIGHLDAAAGVASLIKVTLALQGHKIPKSLHFKQPNPAIDFANSPFFVQQSTTDWQPKNGRRIAGVSAFGIGGTNAHVVVEEAPPTPVQKPSRPWQLLALSARSSEALDAATQQMIDYLANHRNINLADVAFTLQQGRKAFAHRRVVAASSVDNAITALQDRNPKRVITTKTFASDVNVVFMFTGQGAQHVDMGLDLYKSEPIFRKSVDECAGILETPLGFNLKTILYPEPEHAEKASEQLRQTWLTQPAIFTISYALAQLWQSWGVRPTAMAGHSIGEYVAATLAGVFSLPDALALVAERGRLMQGLPPGKMISVPLSEEQIQRWMTQDVSLAAINSPSLSVLSGPAEAIEDITRRLEAEKINVQPLRTSHAFHSAMMDPIIQPFMEKVAQVRRSAPLQPFVSTFTGTWITAEQAQDPAYWSQQIRSCVHFSPAIQELLKTPGRVFLEVGPGNTLSSLVQLQLKPGTPAISVNSLPHVKDDRSDEECMLTALGRLWTTGFPVIWQRLYENDHRQRVPLPTYPFQRKRYWLEARPETRLLETEVQTTTAIVSQALEAQTSNRNGDAKSQAITPPALTQTEQILMNLWQELLGVDEIGLHHNFFDLGGQSLIAVTLINEASRLFGHKFSLDSFTAAPTIAEFAEMVDRELSKRKNGSAVLDLEAIAGQVRQFVHENYLDGNSWKDSDSFRKYGIIDELGTLQFLDFLEDTFHISLRDSGVTADDMDSIENIAQYIHRKLSTAEAGQPRR